jgi:hypothetical protein
MTSIPAGHDCFGRLNYEDGGSASRTLDAFSKVRPLGVIDNAALRTGDIDHGLGLRLGDRIISYFGI